MVWEPNLAGFECKHRRLLISNRVHYIVVDAKTLVNGRVQTSQKSEHLLWMYLNVVLTFSALH